MLEVLQFYVSGFWVWVGITWGMAILLKWIVIGIGVMRGVPIHLGDKIVHSPAKTISGETK